MIYHIKDNVIVENTEAIIAISNNNNKMSIVAQVPLSSSVFLTLHGFKRPYTIPLLYSQTKKEGHVFTGDIKFLLEHIQYINDNPKQVYKGTIIINNIEVQKHFKFVISSITVALSNRQDNDALINLTTEYAKLRADLITFKKSYPRIKLPVTELRKGMIPIATGDGNEYIWDFPFISLYNQVKELIKLNANLAEQNANLVEKVNELEKKLTDHIYEEYEL